VRGACWGPACAGGQIDWGYLKAGDKQFGGAGKQYDMLGDEVLAMPPPPPPPPPAQLNGSHPAQSVEEPPGEEEAWLEPNGTRHAMHACAMQRLWRHADWCSVECVGYAGGEAQIGSVEEALAILERYRKGKGHKEKKAKKKKKEKKEKKQKKQKEKKRDKGASSSDDGD
jgi:hypothetical protein